MNELSIGSTIKWGLILSLILNIILGSVVLSGNSTTSVSPDDIKSTLLSIEYDKVWGKENFELLNKVNLLNVNSQKEWMKQYVESNKAALESGSTTITPPSTETSTTESKSANGTLTQEEIKNILDWAVQEGNKDSDVVLVEYSDLECPFCIKSTNVDKIHSQLESLFAWELSIVFKNNRGVNHSWTEEKALAVLCAKKTDWDKAYTALYKAIYANSDTSTPVPLDKLDSLAQLAGIKDVSSWRSCIDKKETLDEFTAETNEAQKLGLGGTPWTLIFNRRSGLYTTIEGAYEIDAFKKAVASVQSK